MLLFSEVKVAYHASSGPTGDRMIAGIVKNANLIMNTN